MNPSRDCLIEAGGASSVSTVPSQPWLQGHNWSCCHCSPASFVIANNLKNGNLFQTCYWDLKPPISNDFNITNCRKIKKDLGWEKCFKR